MADGQHELSGQEHGQRRTEGIDRQAKGIEEGAGDQRFAPADDVGQVAGGNLHDKNGQGICGLGEIKGEGAEPVVLVKGNQDRRDQEEII